VAQPGEGVTIGFALYLLVFVCHSAAESTWTETTENHHHTCCLRRQVESTWTETTESRHHTCCLRRQVESTWTETTENHHHTCCLRRQVAVYLDGDYREPPSHLLPPPPGSCLPGRRLQRTTITPAASASSGRGNQRLYMYCHVVVTVKGRSYILCALLRFASKKQEAFIDYQRSAATRLAACGNATVEIHSVSISRAATHRAETRINAYV